MDDVEPGPQPVPPHKNSHELVNVLCITGVYSMTAVLWLLFGHDHPVLWMFNVWLLFLIWFVMRLNCLPCGTEPNFIFFVFVYIHYISSNKGFAHRMLVVGSTFVIIGVTCVFLGMVVSLTRNKYQGCYATALVSDKVVMVILSMSCTFFFNGYVALCYSWVKRGTRVWKITGIVLLVVLGLLTTVCCVVRMVSWWRKFHRERVIIRPIEDAVEV